MNGFNMVKLKLIPYKFKIKNVDKSKKGKPVYEDLEGLDFKKYFQEFIKDHQALEIDAKGERIFNCESCKHNSESDIFYGNFGYGDFGYSSEIVNVKTFNVINKGADEAEKIKFYYLIKINKKEAYVLLNQFRHRGIKTQFWKQLNSYLNDKKIITDKIAVELNPLVSSKLLRIKKIDKIRLIKTRKRKDIEGQILDKLDNTDDQEYIEERVFRPRGKFELPKRIIDSLRRNMVEKEYVAIDKIKYDNIKIDVHLEEGCSKTIVFEGGFRFNESIEQEFNGDFPNIDEFYNKTKAYLIKTTC